MEKPAKQVYTFHPFSLDPTKQVLQRNGERVPLTQKAFSTLLALLEQHGKTVAKEELIRRVWQGTAVEENNLNQCISSIRKALGEKPGEHQFILTIPGRGYRFVAEVQEDQAGKGTEHSSERPLGGRAPNTKDRGMVAIGISLAIIAFAIAEIPRIREAVRPKPSVATPATVAVLPFLNLGSNSENDYFSDGFTEELTTALAEVVDLRVVARTSAFQFRGESQDVRQVGAKLSVGAILEGSVHNSGDHLRVTAQLVSSRDGYHLWSHTYEVPQSEIYFVQQDIVRETARALGSRDPHLPTHTYTASPEAHDLYLEGRYYWNKRDLPDMERSAQLFEAAIRKDPNFALAYAGLADAYVIMGGNGQKPLSDVIPRAKPALRRALELDPNLAEAHATLALLNSEITGKRRDLLPELHRAVELRPGYATAHQWLGDILSTLGQFAEADEELRKAQLLDPLSPMITEGLAENFYYWRRYDDVITQVQHIRNMGSEVGEAILGRAYIQKGMYQDAVTVFDHLAGQDHSAFPPTQLAITYAAAHQNHRARDLLRQVTAGQGKYVPPYWIAVAYVYLGEKDAAFRWLQRANQQNDPMLGNLKVDPMLDPIRLDPRYLELLNKADLKD